MSTVGMAALDKQKVLLKSIFHLAQSKEMHRRRESKGYVNFTFRAIDVRTAQPQIRSRVAVIITAECS